MRPLLWAALLLCACDPAVKKCKDNTLFVSVTLQGEAQQADQLFVDVAVDGGTPLHSELSHSAGKGMGGVQIEFPNGYPKGHSIAVTMTAVTLGNPVASDTQSVTLANNCDSLALVLSPGAHPDLSSVDLEGADLAGADISGVDFSGEDFAGVDLATLPDLQKLPDLTTFVDLLNCTPTTENCFNNVDDDCDGLIDCADTDCTSGLSPIAKCIPDPGSFAVGTLVGSAATCPGTYPNATSIGDGFTDSSCQAGTCTCQVMPVPGQCYWTFIRYGSGDNVCMGSGNVVAQVNNFDTCKDFTSVPDGIPYQVLPQWYGSCGSSGGTAQKNNPGFANNQQFCRGTTMGSGCLPGNICVPSAANHCVMKAGVQLPCPPSYGLQAVHYFANITDDKTCSCGCSATPGACGPPEIYKGAGCTNAKVFLQTNQCLTADISANVSLAPGTNPDGVCNPTAYAMTNGSSSPADEQTICCAP